MIRYLPGAILALFGVVAYGIGCVLYMQLRKQRKLPGRQDDKANKTLLVYAIAMAVLGILALGAGLYSLEINQMHALGG